MSEPHEWRSRIRPAQRRVLDASVDIGSRTGVRPFLVGGPVRDLALDLPFADVDLLIEGDGAAFAAELAKALEGELRRFPTFLTWRIDLREGAPIDISTARKESYRQPGALPEVAPSTLHEDLFRRDFAANALALDLIASEVVDPTGGLADIRSRVMRILHPRSFVDDPTRMMRGVRLAARLGFHFEPATADLMEQAIAQNALGSISRERVWREIFLALNEPEPAEALIAMNDRALLERFLSTSPVKGEVLRLIEGQLSIAPEADREVIYAGALLAGASRSELSTRSDQFVDTGWSGVGSDARRRDAGDAGSSLRSGNEADGPPPLQPGLTNLPDGVLSLDGASFSNARQKKATGLIGDAGQLAQRLAEASTPLEQLRLCARSSGEVQVVAAALSDEAGQPIRRFRDYSKLELGIRGDELGLPAGPHISRALEATREAVYLDVIPREEARAFARSIGLQYLKGEIP